jgi:hypothetical protein
VHLRGIRGVVKRKHKIKEEQTSGVGCVLRPAYQYVKNAHYLLTLIDMNPAACEIIVLLHLFYVLANALASGSAVVHLLFLPLAPTEPSRQTCVNLPTIVFANSDADTKEPSAAQETLPCARNWN